jgi:putative flippase GtrA
MKIQKDFFTKRSVLGYIAGGGAYFWSAWLIITFGEKYIGLWWINIIGNAVGITLNYLCQRYLAFPGKNILSSGWRFVCITIVNLFLSYFILKWLTDLGVTLWFAQFISAGMFTVWNYVWYKLWVFKEDK